MIISVYIIYIYIYIYIYRERERERVLEVWPPHPAACAPAARRLGRRPKGWARNIM